MSLVVSRYTENIPKHQCIHTLTIHICEINAEIFLQLKKLTNIEELWVNIEGDAYIKYSGFINNIILNNKKLKIFGISARFETTDFNVSFITFLPSSLQELYIHVEDDISFSCPKKRGMTYKYEFNQDEMDKFDYSDSSYDVGMPNINIQKFVNLLSFKTNFRN